jgi:hypothetical protein
VAARLNPSHRVEGVALQVQQVARDHHQAHAPGVLNQLVQRFVKRRATTRLRGLGKGAHQVVQVRRTRACGQSIAERVVERDQRYGVALARQNIREGREQRRGMVQLTDVTAPPPHRWRDVEREGTAELSFVLEVLDRIPIRACVSAPVDEARIVAGSVSSMLLEDRARSAMRAAVHTRKQSIDGTLRPKREPGQAYRELWFEHVGHGSMLCLMPSITSAGVTPSASARKFMTRRWVKTGSTSARTSSISAA